MAQPEQTLWLFDPANALLVGGISAALSFAGVLLAIAGIVVTIVQVREAKRIAGQAVTAAEAAKTAVGEVKLRIAHYDAIQDVVSARASLAAARSHLDSDDLQSAATEYHLVGQSLGLLGDSISGSEHSFGRRIATATQHIKQFCLVVDSDKPANMPKTRSAMRDCENLLIELHRDISKRAL